MLDNPSRKAIRPGRRVGIVGAGSGGLALAITLQQRGFSPVVMERKAEAAIRSEGIFLTLAPNGINALRAFGVDEAVVRAGIRTDGLSLHNERGKQVALIDYGRHGARFGAPSVTLRRGALSGILLDAALAAGVEVRFETGVTALSQSAEAVDMTTSTGHERFDLVVACDGLRSTVRSLAFPDLPGPVYSGLIGTGGFADAPDVPPTNGLMRLIFGRRAFFGYIRAPGQPVYWFNSYPAPESATGPVEDPEDYARQIAAMHRGDPLDTVRVLTAVERIERHYPIYDMPDLTRWSSGRVLLMGDAAHAVAPHSGQGASMAIEDAVVLAACLADNPDTAFARFEALRRPRTAEAIRIGRFSGVQKQAQSWLSRRLRDLVLPLVMPMAVKAQEQLYGFRADLHPLAKPQERS